MEITIRCERCSRELQPAWVMLPKEQRIVGVVSGYCCCGQIKDAWAGVSELAGVYGAEAVIEAAERLKPINRTRWCEHHIEAGGVK